MNPDTLAAIWLTLKLATVTTVLLFIGTAIASWLARKRSWWKGSGSVTLMLVRLKPWSAHRLDRALGDKVGTQTKPMALIG